jgi:hypothetical protein
LAGRYERGGRNHFAHNAFGNRHAWNHFARIGRASWGGWGGGWGGWGGWVGPVFWPFLLGDVLSCAFWPYDFCYPFWSYGTAFAYDYGPYVPAYGYGGTSNIYGSADSNGVSRRAAGSNPIAADVTQRYSQRSECDRHRHNPRESSFHGVLPVNTPSETPT